MNIAHQLCIHFDFIRLKAGQERQTGVTGAKIVDGQFHAGHAQRFEYFAELVETGDNLRLSHLDQDLFWPETCRQQVVHQPAYGVRMVIQRAWQQVDRQLLFAERKAGGEREGKRFALKVETVAIFRRNGGKHFHG